MAELACLAGAGFGSAVATQLFRPVSKLSFRLTAAWLLMGLRRSSKGADVRSLTALSGLDRPTDPTTSAPRINKTKTAVDTRFDWLGRRCSCSESSGRK